MSNYSFSLQKGNYVEANGPVMKLEYHTNMKKEIGMIEGDIGITLILKLIISKIDEK